MGENSLRAYDSYSIVESSSSTINDIDAEIIIPDTIYRLGRSDRWACNNCNVKGDKWFMLTHPEYCKGKGGNNHSKQIGRR